MLNWANQFGIFCFLDNHSYAHAHTHHEMLLGVCDENSRMFFSPKDVDLTSTAGWLFGNLNYELNLPEFGITKSKSDQIGFPDCFLFEAGILILVADHELTIEAPEPADIFKQIFDTRISTVEETQPVNFLPRLSSSEYIDIVRRLQDHIRRGDCYEINFCQEFYQTECKIDPLSVFIRLNEISPAPFSCFYKLNDKFLACSSPERFLLRKGSQILSQPIKGTIGRNLQDEELDIRLREELRTSRKDQSENVMVVDMVRHDLSKICKWGTVGVEELFGIYSYAQVHQMITTITGELLPNLSFTDILYATFPMGSMTGAPKHRVIQLIDQYEQVARGIFSGSVGYVAPNGDFDFNVVIRSLMYNASTNYLSYQVGSGITIYSDPEQEWEECMLKGRALREASYRC